ncbi:MAG: cytoplasmic protein [Phycisphaerae bacterium]
MFKPVLDPRLERAHRHSSCNRDELLTSPLCGCFHCCELFPPAEIAEWINDALVDGRNGRTAVCPRCGIDSVIGSASGFPITAEFLAAMTKRYF